MRGLHNGTSCHVYADITWKKNKWLKMMEELHKEPMKSHFDKFREDAGVYERSFLQETPNGDFLILTFEGDDPCTSFGKIISGMDREFAEFAQGVHGLDPNGPPPELPKLVYTSR